MLLRLSNIPTAMNAFTIIREHLNDPEYLHVLINPLPVYGLAIGVLALVLALVLRGRRVAISALVMVFVTALSAWPTYHYGEVGYDRVKALSDPAGEQWLDEHMARGEKLIWAFYVLAAISAAGIGIITRWPRTTTIVSITNLALAIGTLGIGGYVAYPGGHVRHREFRFESPPPAREEYRRHGTEGARDHDEHVGKQVTPMDHGSMPGMEASKRPEPQEDASPPSSAAPHAEDAHDNEHKP
jgi:hypothetical protein